MKLLLHTCCAPCLSGVHRAIFEENLDITGYFYNPNIHPDGEFQNRIGALISYASQRDIHAVIVEKYDIGIFKSQVAGQSGDRCSNCYRLRLEEAAKYAGKNNYDCFSSTILISPYQKHDLAKQIGNEMGEKYGVRFYYKDFRPFYRDSIAISKQMGLYRQRYCGCYLSVVESSR